MGRVVFDGDKPTRESKAYLRSEENKILNGPGDEYSKARKLEQFYGEQGYDPDTGLRAGARSYQGSSSSSSSGGGSSNYGFMGKVIGFLILVIGYFLMEKWGF